MSLSASSWVLVAAALGAVMLSGSPALAQDDPVTPYNDDPNYYDRSAASPGEDGRRVDDRRFSAKLSVTPSIRAVYTEPLYGVELEAGFGAKLNHRNLFIYGTIGYLRAETNEGLNVHRPALGAAFEWEFGRWRAGVAPQFSLLLIERATSNAIMAGFGIGGDLIGSVDLYRNEEFGDGLFLSARFGAAYQFPASYYGGGMGLGYRF